MGLVLPAYNESRAIEASLRRLARFLDEAATDPPLWDSWEIVVVDDGSDDRTAEIAGRALGEDARVRVLSLAHAGKGAAVKAGCEASQGDWIVVTDVDLSYALDNVRDAAAALKAGAQMVTGDRRHPGSRVEKALAARGHATRRQSLSRLFNMLVRFFYGIPWRDTQCGLKGFTREAAALIMPRLITRGFLADIEMFLAAAAHRLRVETIPVQLTWLSSDSTVHVVNQAPAVLADALRIKRAQMRGLYL